MGYDVEVVVSRTRSEPRPSSAVSACAGYAHKGRECQRVVQIVRSFHFGCQLSRVEASRVLDARVPSPRHTNHHDGRGRHCRSHAAGLRFPVEADGERIAEALAEILRKPARYATMRRRLETAWLTAGIEPQTRGGTCLTEPHQIRSSPRAGATAWGWIALGATILSAVGYALQALFDHVSVPTDAAKLSSSASLSGTVYWLFSPASSPSGEAGAGMTGRFGLV
jgi:hypothetical protein